MAVKKLVREDGNEILVDRALKDGDGGTIASQEWVQENVPQGPKGDKGDPGSIEGAGFPLTIQNSTGVVKAEFDSGIKSSTEMVVTPHLELKDANDKVRYTAYGIIPFSSSASSATGKLISFPIGEEGTFATREWVEDRIYFGDNTGTEDFCQAKVPWYASVDDLPKTASAIKSAFGLGAQEIGTKNSLWIVFVAIGADIVQAILSYSTSTGFFRWMSASKKLAIGGIIQVGDNIYIVRRVNTGVSVDIWDVLVPLRGRFPVMPLANSMIISVSGMQGCDIILDLMGNGKNRPEISVTDVKESSLTIRTRRLEVSESQWSADGGRCFYTNLKGANAGNGLMFMLPFQTETNNGTWVDSSKILEANVMEFQGTEGFKKYALKLYHYAPIFKTFDTDPNLAICWQVSTEDRTLVASDGTKNYIQFDLRYEFTGTGQAILDYIPYLKQATEAQASGTASIATMSLSAEPPEPASPAVPSGRSGCFTIDEQGRTIDAFTGEIVSE